MGFKNGSYVKIWEVEDKGKYSIANISVSRKNKETDKYETEFQEKFVKLVSNAHKAVVGVEIPKNGLSMRIKSCDVTNKYDTEKKKTYYNFVIFEFEENNAPSTKANEQIQTNVDDDDLPF